MTLIARGDTNLLPLAEIERLRISVWSNCVGPALARARFAADALDFDAWHIGVRHEARLVACGRLSYHESPTSIPDRESFRAALPDFRFPCCIMNRLVVSPAYQRQGLSRVIDEARLECARKLGTKEVWVEAKGLRVERLRRCGFERVCESRDIAIPGAWWILRLSLAQ